MRQEVTMLRGLSYDINVVQFYGSCVKDGKVLLVLEYMEVSCHIYNVSQTEESQQPQDMWAQHPYVMCATTSSSFWILSSLL